MCHSIEQVEPRSLESEVIEAGAFAETAWCAKSEQRVRELSPLQREQLEDGRKGSTVHWFLSRLCQSMPASEQSDGGAELGERGAASTGERATLRLDLLPTTRFHLLTCSHDGGDEGSLRSSLISVHPHAQPPSASATCDSSREACSTLLDLAHTEPAPRTELLRGQNHDKDRLLAGCVLLQQGAG
jgi:hypothetical protein